MRIGIDMMAAQSLGTGPGGIARYVRTFVPALLAQDPANQYLLYYHDALPQGEVPQFRHATPVRLPTPLGTGGPCTGDAVEQLARINPDRLDVLLLPSSFEGQVGYRLPNKPLHALRLATIVYDLIPILEQERILHNAFTARWFYDNVEKLRKYDALMAISAATKADVENYLGVPPHRVFNISAAADERFFVRAEDSGRGAGAATALRRLGIRGPFLFTLGGTDARKNVKGLIAAFALLPEALRRSHQLVIGTLVEPRESDPLREAAARHGVADRLVIAYAVPDATLRSLYQRCAAFVFPSFYEGFGLPILEAMCCGAPVIAGRNSSQVEVVGDAGFLVAADDPAAIAEKIRAVLEDPRLAAELSGRSLEQSKKFRWHLTGERARAALVSLPPTTASGDPRRLPRARVAVFSPLPPKQSPVADDTTRLVEELKRSYRVDLYHDAGYVPDASHRWPDVGCYDFRLFARHDRVFSYEAVLYQFADEPRHKFMRGPMQSRPGVVTVFAAGPPDLRPLGPLLAKARRLVAPDEQALERLRAWAPPSEEGVLLVSRSGPNGSGLGEQYRRIIDRLDAAAEAGRPPGARAA